MLLNVIRTLFPGLTSLMCCGHHSNVTAGDWSVIEYVANLTLKNIILHIFKNYYYRYACITPESMYSML